MATSIPKLHLKTTLIFLLYCTLFSCAGQRQDDIIKMGVFSDAHYLTERLMDNGLAILEYDVSSGKDVSQVPSVLDQVLDDYLGSDIEVLLIPGDMTKDGEQKSHIDFVTKLKPLMDRGVKVYVIPGNHDINIPKSLGYKGSETYKVKNVNPKEFVEIYADCGYKDAIKRDPNSLSYVAELAPSTWLLAIDSEKYEEYSSTYITSSGRVKPETEKWIVEVANEAKQNNIQLVAMMHHSLLEHIPMQATFFANYIVEDWQRLSTLFADLGIKSIFTGHFHINNIAVHSTKNGNKIHDIATGSLATYAFPYRFVELSKSGLNISTKNIVSTPDDPDLLKNNKEAMQERIRNEALSLIQKRGMSFSPKTTSLIADVVAKIFIKRVAGDETFDDDLKNSIQELSTELGLPGEKSYELLGDGAAPELDHNNTKIKF